MIFISDTFTDTDGTSLDAHVIAPVNVPAIFWDLNGGSSVIQGNQAIIVGYSTVNPGIPEGIFSFRWTTFSDPDFPQFRIVLKYQDANNLLFGDFTLLTNQITVYSVIAGVGLQIGAFFPSQTITPGSLFTIRITSAGNYYFYLNGLLFGGLFYSSIFNLLTVFGIGGPQANTIDDFIFYGAGPSTGHSQSNLLLKSGGGSGE